MTEVQQKSPAKPIGRTSAELEAGEAEVTSPTSKTATSIRPSLRMRSGFGSVTSYSTSITTSCITQSDSCSDSCRESATEAEILSVSGFKRGQVIGAQRTSVRVPMISASTDFDHRGPCRKFYAAILTFRCSSHPQSMDGGFLAWLCRAEPLNDQCQACSERRHSLRATANTRWNERLSSMPVPPLSDTQRRIASEFLTMIRRTRSSTGCPERIGG